MFAEQSYTTRIKGKFGALKIGSIICIARGLALDEPPSVPTFKSQVVHRIIRYNGDYMQCHSVLWKLESLVQPQRRVDSHPPRAQWVAGSRRARGRGISQNLRSQAEKAAAIFVFFGAIFI
jgi:hypothetical protein